MKLEDVKFKFTFRSLIECKEEYGVEFQELAIGLEKTRSLELVTKFLAVGMGKSFNDTLNIIDELIDSDVTLEAIIEKCGKALQESKVMGGSKKAPMKKTSTKKK